jgi:DNA-binding transcriptional ArsR family regulator
MKTDDAVLALAALAQPHRLAAFRLLVVAGPSGLTPGVLAERLAMPAPTLSFHLKELLNAGLVTQAREGRNLIYHARFEQMQSLMAFLTENCCCGQACAATTPSCETLTESS